MSTKCSSGAFSLEVNGEVDIRGAYCAAAVATITNLNTEFLFEKTAAWILRCLEIFSPIEVRRRMNDINFIVFLVVRLTKEDSLVTLVWKLTVDTLFVVLLLLRF